MSATRLTVLARLMKYVQGTIGLPLILAIYKSGNIKCYIDEAFTVHKDMRSHNVGFMTMGTGREYVQSRRIFLNNKS